MFVFLGSRQLTSNQMFHSQYNSEGLGFHLNKMYNNRKAACHATKNILKYSGVRWRKKNIMLSKLYLNAQNEWVKIKKIYILPS